MTNPIEWTTAKGSKIVVLIETTEPSLSDERVMNACYKLSVLCNGSNLYLGSGFDVVEHPDVGPALEGWFSASIVPVPADKVDAVRALIAEYGAEIKRRSSASAAEEAEYQARHNAVNNLLATGRK